MGGDLYGQGLVAAGDALRLHGPAIVLAPSPSPANASVHFFLQLAAILVTSTVVGRLGRRFLGQPQVVGEMIGRPARAVRARAGAARA